ncbi:arylsulfatase B [Cephus cinctus]|uniref:Arylsulfatase B n=1 Tax=Cephus cinctus TaxID=211228 RepID=A0AAJ7CDY3_CEPCN|nr:arylsulfatase B [Cephus cinctus]
MVQNFVSGSTFLLYYFFLCPLIIANEYDLPPHIIVIMADDLGWDDVGFHGSNEIPTPNIDALAYNGIILNRHYVLPSCTSSRAAFLTGRYPTRMGLQGDSIQGGEPRGLPIDIKILPEHLQKLGYETRLIGKWHVGFHTPQHTPLHRGFDSFLGFYNRYISYYDYRYTQGNMSGYDMHIDDQPAYGLKHEYATDLFTNEAVRIIDNHYSQRPLYLQISHLAVHAPLEFPPDDYHEENFTHIKEYERRKYAAMVTRLDNSVGRVVSSLGDRGMLKNSLILFLTDNGGAPTGKYRNWAWNYPLRGTKYTLYEGGVRGVAAIWSPLLQDVARVSDQLIHITDWVPTLYAAAGGDIRDLRELDGVNQWRALNHSGQSTSRTILLNIDEISKTEGAIHGRFKLIRGSIDPHGQYDGYVWPINHYRRRVTISYNTTRILHSVVADSIRTHLGTPITQPSTMITLRQRATVECHTNSTSPNIFNVSTCNQTECLFDIIHDPCETKNIAQQYPMRVTDLDQFLAKHSNSLMKQLRLPVDQMADPRRKNGTWQPWLKPGVFVYPNPNGAGAIGTTAICAHIGMALIIVGLRAFI